MKTLNDYLNDFKKHFTQSNFDKATSSLQRALLSIKRTEKNIDQIKEIFKLINDYLIADDKTETFNLYLANIALTKLHKNENLEEQKKYFGMVA